MKAKAKKGWRRRFSVKLWVRKKTSRENWRNWTERTELKEQKCLISDSFKSANIEPQGASHCFPRARITRVLFKTRTFCVCVQCFVVSLWLLSRFCGSLAQSKDMHLRLIGNSKLSLGVSVCCLVLSRVTVPSHQDSWKESRNPQWPRVQDRLPVSMILFTMENMQNTLAEALAASHRMWISQKKKQLFILMH